ncbi:MAG: hypothetical protein BWY09_03104 [Candidatus Hydrogenedentes bacterium ADurb.Bin179]|nr:MAG: hypothetical protein BWY09_03104 [Candidatus Hydrogenedentes bacterium ADurb.Bin179]
MVAPAQCAHLHEEGRVGIPLGGGHMFDNGFKQGVHALLRTAFRASGQPSMQPGTIQRHKIALFLCGAEGEKEIESFVKRAHRVGMGTVHLVDDDNRT